MTKGMQESLKKAVAGSDKSRAPQGLNLLVRQKIDETKKDEFISLSQITRELALKESERTGTDRKHAVVSAVYQVRTGQKFTATFTPYHVTKWNEKGEPTEAEPIVGKGVNRDQLYLKTAEGSVV